MKIIYMKYDVVISIYAVMILKFHIYKTCDCFLVMINLHMCLF